MFIRLLLMRFFYKPGDTNAIRVAANSATADKVTS